MHCARRLQRPVMLAKAGNPLRRHDGILVTLVVSVLLGGCTFGGASNTQPVPTSKKSTAPTAVNTTAETPKPAASEPTEAHFREALQLMQSRDYAKAEPLLLELTRRQPQLSGPWLNLGILYARTSRNAPAITALRQGLKLNPKSPAAQNQLGILLRESGQLHAAEQAYQAALSASPNYANAHLNLGVLYDVHLKQPGRALGHYQQYQKLAPADTRVAVWIADLKQRMQGKS